MGSGIVPSIAERTSSVSQELLYLILVFPKVLEMPKLVEGIDLILSIRPWLFVRARTNSLQAIRTWPYE